MHCKPLLATDPRDVGCGETFELIHAYADIAADGRDPEQSMPGVTVAPGDLRPLRRGLPGAPRSGTCRSRD